MTKRKRKKKKKKGFRPVKFGDEYVKEFEKRTATRGKIEFVGEE